MALKVTKPITKYGRYYTAGEVLDSPSSLEQSLGRLLGWKTVAGQKARTSGSASSTRRRKKTTPAVLDGDPVDMPADE